MDSEWVTIAHLTRPRGNKGELCAISLSAHPERYQQLRSVQVAGREFEVERVWYHKDQPVFKLRGIDSIGEAETLAGEDVQVPAADRFPLPDDEYYFADLMDCRVIDQKDGSVLGAITGWQELGGPVVLEVDDGKHLIPFVKSMLQIDLANREIRVSLPEGLLDL